MRLLWACCGQLLSFWSSCICCIATAAGKTKILRNRYYNFSKEWILRLMGLSTAARIVARGFQRGFLEDGVQDLAHHLVWTLARSVFQLVCLKKLLGKIFLFERVFAR